MMAEYRPAPRSGADARNTSSIREEPLMVRSHPVVARFSLLACLCVALAAGCQRDPKPSSSGPRPQGVSPPAVRAPGDVPPPPATMPAVEVFADPGGAKRIVYLSDASGSMLPKLDR